MPLRRNVLRTSNTEGTNRGRARTSCSAEKHERRRARSLGAPAGKAVAEIAADDKFAPMEKPQITAYLKTHCGWSGGVRAVLAKYDLPYTEKDIIQNPAFRWEMETKSGQPLSPCVEINGEMLADISGEEVERYLIDKKLVEPSGADAGVPINAPCANEQHGEAVKLRF